MLRHYLRLSVKVLLRRRFFTFISIFGISFTLLVLMVVTALLDHMFAPMAPETRQHLTLEARRVAGFNERQRGGIFGLGGYALFDRYARDLPGAERMSIYTDTSGVTSYQDGRKITATMKRTDSEFWNILQFTFVEGRPYSAQEVNDGARVAVVNASTRARFFGDLPAVGRAIDLNGRPYLVVGVVEDVSLLRDVPAADIWAPITTLSGSGWRETLFGNFKALVLASRPEALSQIRDEFNARLARLNPSAVAGGGTGEVTRIVAPLDTKFQAFARNFAPLVDVRDPQPQAWRVMILFGVLAGLFTLLPTVNLVNVNISRIMERASEIGVRKAFGASAANLVGQFVVENIILSLAGGVGGLLLSVFVLNAISASGVIPYADLGINLRVFVAGFLLSVAFGIVSGVYPAWRMARLHPVDGLHGGRR